MGNGEKPVECHECDEVAEVTCADCMHPLCTWCCHHGMHQDLSDNGDYVDAQARLTGESLTKAEWARRVMALNTVRRLTEDECA